MRALVCLAVAVGSLVLATRAARADQCELVDADQAAWAQKLVVRGATVAAFCESCGDTQPGEPFKVNAITATKDHGGMHVHVNGKTVDLAYTYLQTGKTTWANVGSLVGCPVQGVTAIYAGATGGNGALEHIAQIPELGAEFGECQAYVHVINQLAKCSKMPAASRDALRQSVDALKSSFAQWKSMPKESRDAMQNACKQAKDAVVQSMTAMGCKP
jgi:hypothetical protein